MFKYHHLTVKIKKKKTVIDLFRWPKITLGILQPHSKLHYATLRPLVRGYIEQEIEEMARQPYLIYSQKTSTNCFFAILSYNQCRYWWVACVVLR